MPPSPTAHLKNIPLYNPEPGSVERSSWTRAYYTDPINTQTRAYREAGPVFKINHIGEEVIAMGGLEANKTAWGDNKLWDYPTSNKHFREQFSDRYLNQLEGRVYRKKRQRVTAGFKPSMLMQHTRSMSEVVVREIEKLSGDWTNLRSFCMRIIIAMTSRSLMQVDLPPGMDQTMAISNKHMLKAHTLGMWRHLWYLRPDRIYRRKKIFGYLNSILDERERNPVEQDDILSLSLNAHPKDEPPIPRQELIHDLSQLMMAGSTTTSHTILWNLVFSAITEAWNTKLLEELEGWDADSFSNMGDFPRLRASCMEIERLRPPSMYFDRLSKKPIEFQGVTIPERTWVMHIHSLGHFLPEVYDNPLSFDPDRFLRDPDLPRHDAHGLFGGGAHVCAGAPLARVLQPVAVASILSNYQIEFKEPPDTHACIDVVLAPRVPYIVRFKRR
ncbi:MAG: cytochrome P450 [Opitutales bacterium]|nr:cytochrome P450 [Opitutales bacterium]NRA28069.1 cytochrome P450 [Opitutales bacterium]